MGSRQRCRIRASRSGSSCTSTNAAHGSPLMPHAGYGVRHDGSTGKEVAGELYMPLRKTAALHARDLSNNHANNGTLFPDDNPSSGVFRLLAAIEHGTTT